MATLSAGAVVFVRFPFSDLSSSKLRPAIVLADAGKGDWVMSQVTSKPYADSLAVEIKDEDFLTGALKQMSYARPGKLFTANEKLVMSKIGILKKEGLENIVGAVVRLIQFGLQA
jgi:mRNA interferase MazF